MAQKTTVVLIDDFDGGDASESLSFGLDGIEYTIDLSTDNAGKLRDALGEFISNARRIGGRKAAYAAPRTRAAVAVPSRSREENTAIREWARRTGTKVSDRGRIPVEVVEAFNRAHA